MNKRIRELAMNAGYELDMFGMGHWDMLEFRSYTKLIIQETINEMCQQLQLAGDDQSNNPKFYKAIEKTLEALDINETDNNR